jgi:hypothetical protein
MPGPSARIGPAHHILLNHHGAYLGEFADLSQAEKDDVSSQILEVCFESNWRPNIVIRKSYWISKRYFTRQGHHGRPRGFSVLNPYASNKIHWARGIPLTTPKYDERLNHEDGIQGHALQLNLLGFQFYVLRQHFLLQLAASNKNGLDDRDGTAEIHRVQSKMHPTHFDYTGGYLREVVVNHGPFYYWPRGCSQPMTHIQSME